MPNLWGWAKRRLVGPALTDAMEIELARISFRRLTIPIFMGTVAITAGAACGAVDNNNAVLAELACALAFIGLFRVMLSIGFNRRAAEQISADSVRGWNRSYGFATVLYSLVYAMLTIYQFGRRDAVGAGLCLLGTFAVSFTFSSRTGTKPWIAHVSGMILLAGLAIGIVELNMPRTGLAIVLMLILAVVHWECAETRFMIVLEELETKRKLAELSEQDMLTGLGNRRRFHASLDKVGREAVPFAVHYLDLDHFKEVNDAMGHEIGDRLLQMVAGRLRGATRTTDLVARLGGDEFAIVQWPLPDTEAAQTLAARLVDAIVRPYDIDGRRVEIEVSVGFCLSETVDGDPKEVVRRADKALYEVKHAGKGSFATAG